MVAKRGPPTTISLKLHIPVVLGAEGSFTPGQWARANLNSATEISRCRASGGGHATPVPCSGIEPLYTVVRDNNNVAVQSLLVRAGSPPASVSPPQERRPAATAVVTAAPAAPFAAPADLWVELDVSGVRPDSFISSDPALLSAWRLLLPRLVTYAREEAVSPQRVPPTQEAGGGGEGAARGREGGDRSGGGDTPGFSGGRRKKMLEARALEAVYASLKPTSERLGLADEGAGDAGAAVGPAPGASGLNAVPAAVVMKGATFCVPVAVFFSALGSSGWCASWAAITAVVVGRISFFASLENMCRSSRGCPTDCLSHLSLSPDDNPATIDRSCALLASGVLGRLVRVLQGAVPYLFRAGAGAEARAFPTPKTGKNPPYHANMAA